MGAKGIDILKRGGRTEDMIIERGNIRPGGTVIKRGWAKKKGGFFYRICITRG